nr:MAG TPA: hypothetical protein [Crassvirales sp.]
MICLCAYTDSYIKVIDIWRISIKSLYLHC